MDRHERYLQQASWTRDLRDYLLDRAGIQQAERVLEVGCGTGAVLIDLAKGTGHVNIPAPKIHGLDIEFAALQSARVHAPGAALTCADAHRLPFADQQFDICCCHFLLLWLSHPSNAILEFRRVTRPGGHLLALAEPDYSKRDDHPAELAELGTWQEQALMARGADPAIGSRIADLFDRAGVSIVETGAIAMREPGSYADAEWKAEWNVLREDLAGYVPVHDLDALEDLDLRSRRSGARRMHVPTYFVHAQV